MTDLDRDLLEYPRDTVVEITSTCPTCEKKFTRDVPVEQASNVGILGLEMCPSCCPDGLATIVLSTQYGPIDAIQHDTDSVP